MNPRITKDIRLLRPAWLLTAGLMIVSMLLPNGGKGWVAIIAVFGCLVVAATIFGAEFGHGTISQLLTQPIDRRPIWREKMLIMAAALGSLILLLLTIEAPAWPVAVVAACAFCTIPFFTLVGRSTISGIILSIPIPGIIFVVGALLALWLLRPSGLNEERLHFWVRAYCYILLPAYCALVFYLGYRRFLTFEIAGREQPQVRLPAAMQAGLERLASSILPIGHRHLRSLIAKELHLQHNAAVLVLIFSVLQLLAIVYVKLTHVPDAEHYFVVPLFIYIATMPLVIGSSAIAEETNLGTRAWHLTLPVSVRTQWFTKLGVVLVFAIIMGIGVPLLWVAIGFALGIIDLTSPDTLGLVLFCLSVLLVTAIAFYASSFSRDTLRALLTAFGLCIGLVFILAVSEPIASRLAVPILKDADMPSLLHTLIANWILLGVSLTCFLVVLLRGSFKHFATLAPRRIWTNVLLVFLSPILLFISLHTLTLAIIMHR